MQPTHPLPDGSRLAAHWMPFSGNRQFKRDPRYIVAAEGRYYTDGDGRRVFDSLSGLWTCGLGHRLPQINEAVARQMETLDYSPAFQYGHPLSFHLAHEVVSFMPDGLNRVFFSCSGSEAVETALKIARAYWRLQGRPEKQRLVGRGRGYHGVNMGGTGVGGLERNRQPFGEALAAEHLRHTLLAENRFAKGQPEQGAELAEELQEIIGRHGAGTIAAVIVEPLAGSGGVLPPPQGYLQRLREICTEHDILLIFDEVICGFGRLGYASGSEAFGVVPDIAALAKQLTNGAVPMGATLVRQDIYDAFMAQDLPDYMLELPHGYTYSAHPVACAAALAVLEMLRDGEVFAQVRAMAPVFEAGIHELQGRPHVADIRNYGLAGGIGLEPYPNEPARRPFEVAMRMWQKGFYVRYGGDTIQIAPPFTTTEDELQHLFTTLSKCLV